MPDLDYSASPLQVRSDIEAAHRAAWEQLGEPGTWLTGAERVAVAAETRAAASCVGCSERKAALSPYAVEVDHEVAGDLPPAWVEVVHRVRTDAGRLSKRFYDEALSSGISEEQYVEILGALVRVTSIDTFCEALGLPLHALPQPQPGEPSRHRPSGAKQNGAWVPTLAPKDARGPEANLYPPTLPGMPVPNVAQALTLVPDEMRAVARMSAVQYASPSRLMDMCFRRALSRPQMEFIAARVSALNQCFY